MRNPFPTTLSLEEHALWFLFLLSNVTIFNETLLRQYHCTSFIFGCETHGMLVPRPGIRQAPPALEVQCLNPWTTKGSRACPLKCHQHTRHNWSLHCFPAAALDCWPGRHAWGPKQTGDCCRRSFVWPLQVETSSTHHLFCIYFGSWEGVFPSHTISIKSH